MTIRGNGMDRRIKSAMTTSSDAHRARRDRESNMLNLLKSLRRGPEDHREIFADFAVLLVFVVADHLAAKQQRPKLRVVR